jgi:hypothetical protein
MVVISIDNPGHLPFTQFEHCDCAVAACLLSWLVRSEIHNESVRRYNLDRCLG